MSCWAESLAGVSLSPPPSRFLPFLLLRSRYLSRVPIFGPTVPFPSYIHSVWLFVVVIGGQEAEEEEEAEEAGDEAARDEREGGRWEIESCYCCPPFVSLYIFISI